MTAIPRPRSKAFIVSFAILLPLTCVIRTHAASLDDYRHRVSQAVASTAQLQSIYDDEDPSQREPFVAATIARLRDLLPAKETVQFERQSVAVDNAWLHDALNDYEKTASNNARRAELVARIDERLRALGERLDEMQKGSAAGNKDDDKARLAEILRRPEYNKSAAEGSALERLWMRFIRWLFSLFPKVKPMQPGNAWALSKIAQIVVIGVSLAGIAFLIWKFLPGFLRNRGKKKQKREVRIVLGERLEPDQTSADLLAQAEALARSGDLRAAIRKAYIALLCELGDRKILSLAQHKTNRDYLNAVRGKSSLYSSMRGLTNSFELHWYGFVPAGESDWSDFRSGYRKAVMGDK